MNSIFFLEYIRPGLCVKGLFTRERQPKMAAYVVKERFNQFTSNSAWKNQSLKCYTKYY